MTPKVNAIHAARLERLGSTIMTPLGASATVLGMPARLRRLSDRHGASRRNKRLRDIASVFDAFEISDGAVLSFHHHYRDGDELVNQVMAVAHARGLKDLTLAASSLFPVHAPLVPLIEAGTITRILTDYMRGPVADCVACGGLRGPALLQSHGGRARAIAAGQIRIDAAFVAAPVARCDGAATGRAGRNACGPLGYPAVDAAFARATAVFAAEVIDGDLPFTDIPADHVDAVVAWERIGNTTGIQSGSTRPSESAGARRVAELVTAAIRAAGYLKDGMSLQSGAGGYSLGSVPHVGRALREAGVTGGFLSGGIAAAHADLLAQGVFGQIHDVQCFDLEAVRSSIEHPAHEMMTAEAYASPLHPCPVVSRLDVMLLGAVEIDAEFNVNVISSATGRILGGPGGHPDTAAGARLRIVTTDLTGGGLPKLVPHVHCVATPGTDIDLVVTPQGVAVHPERGALADRLRHADLPVVAFDDLAARAASEAGSTVQRHRENDRERDRESHRPHVLVEMRDGRILDWV